jgi:hypothetical protein
MVRTPTGTVTHVSNCQVVGRSRTASTLDSQYQWVGYQDVASKKRRKLGQGEEKIDRSNAFGGVPIGVRGFQVGTYVYNSIKQSSR